MKSTARVSLGRRGEELAVGELARRGYEIVARNWRSPFGEVDVVARRDEVYYFFEVRTRRGREYGSPEESLTPAKRRRMLKVALAYLGECLPDEEYEEPDWRLGFVAVEMDRTGKLLRLEVYDSIT